MNGQSVFLVLAAVACLMTLGASAAACDTATQLSCSTTAGFVLNEVVCLQTNPATCSQVICNQTRWFTFYACLNGVPCTLDQTDAVCRSTFQVCPTTLIDTLCALVAPTTAAVTSAPTPAAATPAPPVTSKWSGILTLSGDWTAILSDISKTIAIKFVLESDLGNLLGQAVTIVSLRAGSLIVTWETVAVVTNSTLLQTRAAAATASSSWMASTQATYLTNGGTGTVTPSSNTAQAGPASGSTGPMLSTLTAVIIAVVGALLITTL